MEQLAMECRMNGFKVWYVFRLLAWATTIGTFVVADNSHSAPISYFLNAEAWVLLYDGTYTDPDQFQGSEYLWGSPRGYWDKILNVESAIALAWVRPYGFADDHSADAWVQASLNALGGSNILTMRFYVAAGCTVSGEGQPAPWSRGIIAAAYQDVVYLDASTPRDRIWLRFTIDGLWRSLPGDKENYHTRLVGQVFAGVQQGIYSHSDLPTPELNTLRNISAESWPLAHWRLATVDHWVNLNFQFWLPWQETRQLLVSENFYFPPSVVYEGSSGWWGPGFEATFYLPVQYDPNYGGYPFTFWLAAMVHADGDRLGELSSLETLKFEAVLDDTGQQIPIGPLNLQSGRQLIPEPSGFAMLISMGLITVAAAVRRRRRSVASAA